MQNPPRLAGWLLRLVLPAEDHETIAGDLEEMFRQEVLPHAGLRRARRWFWRQSLSIASARLLAHPTRPPLEAPRHGDIMHGLRQDIRYAFRGFIKTPAFTLIAVATLALGIGANTAIFTLVNGLMFKPLPFAAPDQLMMVHLLVPQQGVGGPMEGQGAFRELPWSYPKYEVFRDEEHVFSDHALFTRRDWSLTGIGDAERVRGEVTGARYLTTLGLTPHLGRDFTAEEDRAPGIDGVVMLGHELWQRRFGGDRNVLGRVIRLDSVPYTVVGVLSPGFRGLTGEAQLWVPVMSMGARDLSAKWNHWAYLVARRRAGVSDAQAGSAVALLGRRVDEAIGQPPGIAMPTMRAVAVPLDRVRVDPLIRQSALVLFAAVGFVLLIGCVNLANLLLARGVARQREVALRLAIGATRGRVVRQFLTESLILSATGALAGLALAYGALRLGAALMPEPGMVLRSPTFGLTRIGAGLIEIDLTALGFTLVIATATAIFFGLMPAWHASRADIVGIVKAGGAGSIGSPRGIGVRGLLVASETALALVLLVASGLMLQSVRNLQHTELGFDPDGLLTARFQLPELKYNESRSTRFFVDLMDRVRALPGVESVAYGKCPPVSGGCDATGVQFLDRAPVPRGSEPITRVQYASPDFFRTLGVRVLKGRSFTARDSDGQPLVVMINESFARTHFGQEDPLGKRIALGTGGGFQNGAEIVGVINDVRYGAVESAPTPDTYIPMLQRPRAGGLLFIRTQLDPSAIVPGLRREVAALDRDLPVTDIKLMDARFADATWRIRLSAQLLGAFSALALLLAVIGVYGVMAQAVQQRTREIGVRMALGAERRSILRLVIGRGMTAVAAGIGIGLALSLAGMRLLETLLYQVKPNDPVALVVPAAGLLAIALVASYLPARRATEVDPLTVLRSE